MSGGPAVQSMKGSGAGAANFSMNLVTGGWHGDYAHADAVQVRELAHGARQLFSGIVQWRQSCQRVSARDSPELTMWLQPVVRYKATS